MLKKLIIVDDDTPFRERLGRSMEKKGFFVETFANYEDCLKRCFEESFDYAVVDMRHMFYVNDNSFVSQLSTGQQKTIILLMYLSQCKYLSEINFKQPILLLDEVCSHLDDINRNVLLTLIETFKLQIFMTGTSENLFSFLSTNANFCNITD